MKSVLISIQPYWVFLIIARKMGWDIPQNKSVEIRKTCPKEKTWNKKAIIYCTQDKKSFYRIPKEYQELMRPLLGKVLGEFVCDRIIPISITYSDPDSRIALKEFSYTCLTDKQIIDYLGNGKTGYGWYISDLKIYDEPRHITHFCKEKTEHCGWWECDLCKYGYYDNNSLYGFGCQSVIKRPPQSWCYVEELK